MQNRFQREMSVKAAADSGDFEMYASIFGNVDLADEIVKENAFVNLDEFVRTGWVAHNHKNYDLAVGYPVSAAQDSVGLKITGKFHTTPEAQALRTVVIERLAAGKAVKSSIGYRVLDESTEVIDGRRVRLLTRLELLEVSFVNLPANPLAEVVSAKQLLSVDDALEIVRGLKQKDLTDKQISALQEWLGQLERVNGMSSEIKALIAKNAGDKMNDQSLMVVAEAVEIAARHGLTIL